MSRWWFVAEEDSDQEEERRDEGRAQLQTPRDSTSVLDNDIGGETEEDTSNDPELPEHDERASNASRGHLSRVNWDSCILRADSDSHDEAGGEESLPGLSESRTNGGSGQAASSDENLTTTTKVVVERVNDEGTTTRCQPRDEYR